MLFRSNNGLYYFSLRLEESETKFQKTFVFCVMNAVAAVLYNGCAGCGIFQQMVLQNSGKAA